MNEAVVFKALLTLFICSMAIFAIAEGCGRLRRLRQKAELSRALWRSGGIVKSQKGEGN